MGVAQAFHQHVPGLGHAVRAPAQLSWLAGKAVAGNRGDHDVESVFGATAVSGRIGQRADGLEKLELRTRPAMGKDQRHGVGMTRTHMNELDVDTIDRGDEFGQCIEPGLGLAPVITVAPILHQVLYLGQLHALGNVVDGFLVRPTGVGNALAQFGQLRVIDMDAVWTDGFGLRRLNRAGWRDVDGGRPGPRAGSEQCETERTAPGGVNQATVPGANG